MRISVKHLLLLFCCLGTAVAAQPEPIFGGQPVLVKATGTGCGPCGTYGWNYFHNAITKYDGKIFPVAAYTGGSLNSNPDGQQDLSNGASGAILNSYGVSSYPTLYVNMKSSGNDAVINSNIDAHLEKTWAMGMNFSAWTELDDLKIARVFKTNEVLSGNFQLNTFVTEDNILHYQSGRSEALANHSAVLRYTATIISGSNRGTPLPQSALNGTVYRDTITIPMQELWVKKNLKIGLVLYKDGGIYNAYTRADTWLGEVPRNQFTLSVNSDRGSVERSPARDLYDSAYVVTLEATPHFGNRFTGWSGDLSGTENPITITMNSNKSVVANYEQLGGVTEIPRSELSVFAVSSEEEKYDHFGSYLLDGDPETYWHSRWTGGKVEAPHWVVLKLSEARAISGVYVHVHHYMTDGMLQDYSIYLSNDGVNWGTAVATGTAAANKGGDIEKIFFGANGEFTYFKLVWETGRAGYGSAAELQLFHDPDGGEYSSSSSSGSDSSSSSDESAALTLIGQQSLQLLAADAQGIRFTLSAQGTTTLRLVNITGQQLFEKTVSGESGTQEISWGMPLNKGVYFATLKSSLGAQQSIRFAVR